LKKYIAKDLIEEADKLRGLNSVENRGEIEEIKNLMVNLHKSKTKNHNEKDTKIWGWYWSSAGAKLQKNKSSRSIRDVIKRNQKPND